MATMTIMPIEVSYRRTMQVREFESVTIEAKMTGDSFNATAIELEGMVDTELERHCKALKAKHQVMEGEDLIDETP